MLSSPPLLLEEPPGLEVSPLFAFLAGFSGALGFFLFAWKHKSCFNSCPAFRPQHAHVAMCSSGAGHRGSVTRGPFGYVNIFLKHQCFYLLLSVQCLDQRTRCSPQQLLWDRWSPEQRRSPGGLGSGLSQTYGFYRTLEILKKIRHALEEKQTQEKKLSAGGGRGGRGGRPGLNYKEYICKTGALQLEGPFMLVHVYPQCGPAPVWPWWSGPGGLALVVWS